MYKLSQRITKKRSYKNFDPEAFRLEVRKISWWNIHSCNDVNLAVQLLSDKLTKILDEMAPIKVFQSGTNYAPWLSVYLKTGSNCGMMHVTRLSRLELVLT